MALRAAVAMPCSPVALGCTGAARCNGTTGSTQRVDELEHASFPMLGEYTSTYVAWWFPASVAIVPLSCFSLARRYGTSLAVIGINGQHPPPESGRIAG